MELNKEQEEAANFGNGICAVIAVPGSGKTLTMTQRIGILVTRHNVSPDSILGLTFTRNAAKEMRKRLKGVLENIAEKVNLCTIHSFCLNLLRNEGKLFNILTGGDQIRLIRQVMREQRVRTLSIGLVAREISLAKSNLLTAEEMVMLHADSPVMERVAGVYLAYEEMKAKKSMLDFDDLLLETYTHLEKNPELVERLKETYRHVLIDEFQDLNPAQLTILSFLIDDNNDKSSFWICGDDWQSIYAFNGASVGNILKFHEVYPTAKEFILSVNYRSTPQILKACQNLINHNQKRKEKPLTAFNQKGKEVVVSEAFNEEDEANRISDEIKDLVERYGYKHRDIAVLYRANFQSRVLEEVFSEQLIPYRLEAGSDFFKRFKCKMLVDYLKVIIDPNSEEGTKALLKVLNVPNRYLGSQFIQELEADARAMHRTCYESLKSMDISTPFQRKNVAEFLSVMEPIINRGGSLNPSEAIRYIRDAFNIDRFLADGDIPSPDDEKIGNVNQLQLGSAKFSTIPDFLEHVRLFTENKGSNNRNGVRCMTIHKAKGMEFSVVFVIGLVEGILPTKNGDIEEERRICFVGISRAKEILYLTTSANYLGQPAVRSLFLDEMFENKELKTDKPSE